MFRSLRRTPTKSGNETKHSYWLYWIKGQGQVFLILSNTCFYRTSLVLEKWQIPFKWSCGNRWEKGITVPTEIQFIETTSGGSFDMVFSFIDPCRNTHIIRKGEVEELSLSGKLLSSRGRGHQRKMFLEDFNMKPREIWDLARDHQM